MKKIYALLGTVVLAGTAAGTMVSCASKTIESIQNDKIKLSNGKFNIMNWTSSVVSNDNYKSFIIEEVIDIFRNNGSDKLQDKNVSSGLDIYGLVTKSYDKNSHKQGNGNLASQIIYEYQKTSNDNVMKNKKDTEIIKELDKNLDYKIYSSGGDLIKDNSNSNEIVQYNSDTKVVVFNFELGIEAKENSAVYTGAKQYIVKDNSSKFKENNTIKVSDYAKKYFKDITDKKDIEKTGLIKSKDKWDIKNDYNYRYPVKFNFAIG